MLTQAVDLFPTLLELAMQQVPPLPACPHATQASRAVWLCTDGASVASAVIGGTAAISTHTPPRNATRAAFSQVPRGALVDGEPGNVAGETYMGYTMRTDAWR